MSDEASWALALFPACCQPDLSSHCVYHCFFQHHRPGATYQLTSGYSRLFCFLHFLSVSLSLSSLDAPLAPRPVTEGSYFHAGICFWCLMTNPRQSPLLEKSLFPEVTPLTLPHIFSHGSQFLGYLTLDLQQGAADTPGLTSIAQPCYTMEHLAPQGQCIGPAALGDQAEPHQQDLLGAWILIN